MLNLRYHIVSLTAVFLALGLGLALGATFVDSVLVNILEGQVNQLEADTRNAIAERDAAVAVADGAQAEIEAAVALNAETQQFVTPFLPHGRLNGRTVLLIAPEGVDPEAVAALRDRLRDTKAVFGGVLWLSDELAVSDAAVRMRISEAFSLAGNSERAVRRALRFLVPQALFRPAEAFESTNPRTRTALTVLRDLGLVRHDGTGAIPLHEIGGEELVIVVVADVMSDRVNEGLVFDVLAEMSVQGDRGRGVVIEVPIVAPVDAAALGPLPAYGTVADRVRTDPLLSAAFSSVDRIETFVGDLALLTALENLPSVGHYSQSQPWHGLIEP